MTDLTEKERCARGCMWLGAGVGLAAILMLWLLAGWGFILSVVVGAILGALAAFLFSFIFCSKLTTLQSDKTVAQNAGAAAASAAQPLATSAPVEEAATTPSAGIADDASVSTQEPVAVPDEVATAPDVDVSDASTASASSEDTAQAAEKSAFSGMKPSKELKGQQELSSRKGSYKYVAPAAEAVAPASKTSAASDEAVAPVAEKPVAKKAAPKAAVEEQAAAPAAFADIPAGGGAAAVEEAKPETLTEARGGVSDDLKLISGVGPKLEQTLNELGFYHFDQIARWGDAEVAWVDSRIRFKGRILRDNWMAQAKILADGGETEFSARKK